MSTPKFFGNLRKGKRSRGRSQEPSSFSCQLVQDPSGRVLLPRNVFPGTLSDLGISVADSSGPGRNVEAVLPEGWKVAPDPLPRGKQDTDCWYLLLDQKERRRASIYTGNWSEDPRGHVMLLQRFGIAREVEEGDFSGGRPRIGVAWAAYDGQTPIYRSSTTTALEEDSLSGRSAQEQEVRDWLRTHYPDWESHLSYWD